MRALAVLALLGGCGSGGPSIACLDPAGKAHIGTVGACPLSVTSWRFATSLMTGPPDQKTRLFDALIARELLAQGAQEAGVAPLDPHAVAERMAKGELHVLGSVTTLHDDDPLGRMRDLARMMGISADELVAEQGRELLADAMRARLGSPAAVAKWVDDRCHRELAAGHLAIVDDLIPRDDEGHPLPYKPCAAPPPAP